MWTIPEARSRLEVCGSLFDKTYVGQAVLGSFSAPTALNSWSKVVINVDDDTSYEAGTDTGRMLTVTIPYGTPQMARDILARLQGQSYQSYEASTALLDPAAELGDAVEVRGVFGGIYKRDRKLDKLYSADIAAPGDEEIDHEYPYQSSQARQIVRERKQTKASLQVLSDNISAEVSARIEQGNELTSRLDIQSGQISARVTKTGGDSSSFGWELLNDSWTVKANNTTVFKVTKSGAEVRGKITALSGKIGGFDIQSDYLSYNNQVWNGTNSRGIYIGVNGIQCGPEANGVQITPAGNLYAENGYFRGSVSAGQIQYGYNSDGEYNGYFNGEGLESRSVSGLEIATSTVSTINTNEGINTSLAYAEFSNDVFNGDDTATWVLTDFLQISGHQIAFGSINGTNVLTWH